MLATRVAESKPHNDKKAFKSLKRKASDAEREITKRVPKKGAALAELVKQVLSIWEHLRPRDLSIELKHDLVDKIIKISQGRLKDLALKSKASRVVQAVLKHGTKQQKNNVWTECKDHILELSMSPYGNHVVRKLISIGDEQQLSGEQQA